MESQENPFSKALLPSLGLYQQLAAVLPKGFNFKLYHLSTPPTRSSALYSAPPGARKDRTYCENHFLTVSIDIPSNAGDSAAEVIVFAIEILVYSTAYDTTFFVSKADSTGYLHLLNLPKGSPSPLREISAVFLRHLVEQHQRENIRSIVSLFARAQDQYLFPRSVEYSGKHVLDDRGLVRWWCRVLDPLITETPTTTDSGESQWETVKGYLIVPGLDLYETKSYIPPKSRTITTNPSWTIGHPLQFITRHSDDVPPRCLIPRFPDDPKARFLDELDDEVSKDQSTGHWKSVRSIDQFWEMMAYRQECSAGRLVGFIWIIFEPNMQHEPTDSVLGDGQTTHMSDIWDADASFGLRASTPASSFAPSSQVYPFSSPAKSDATIQNSPQRTPSTTPSKKHKKKLSGPVIPRQPRFKTENKNNLLSRPESTAYYIWRPSGRGQVIVDDSDYKRITELLLLLDFSNLKLATSSSKRWIDEVRNGAPGSEGEVWGQTVTGTREVEVRKEKAADGVNTLNMGLVRKKRKNESEGTAENPSTPQVNVLSGGMIRKKAKT